MKRFHSIEQFRYVVKSIFMHYEYIEKLNDIPTLEYVGTVKLHGTNAGIRRTPSGKIQPQSRERILSATSDNYGFAKFIEAIPLDDLNRLFDEISPVPHSDITIYGEWIGKGIQGKTGVGQLDKQWVIFGASVNDEYIENCQFTRLPQHNIFNILDIGTYEIFIDFKNPEGSIEQLKEITTNVENSCPWAKHFDVDGIGEGVVWVRKDSPWDSDYWFKIKGQKHSGKDKSKKEMVTIDPQKVENIEQCVDIIVTEERLNQGLEFLKENELELDMRNIGKYLKWIGQDTMKEELDTVEANNLEWSDVVKVVTLRAKKFFMEKVDTF